MANLTLRLVKGSPLTNAEVDENFSNLNTAKYEAGDSPDFVDTTTDVLSLDTTATITPTQGQMTWSDDDRTAVLGLNGLALPVGQEELLFVRNSTGSPIAKGTAVMATGTIGASGRITAAPMDGTNVANAKFLIGIAAETIAAGADGFVANFGKVRGFDTSAFAAGSVLWVSTTTAGALTTTEPTSGLKLPIAFVVTSHANVGAIFVRMTTGVKFSEAHDATFTSLANGDVLVYNSGVWENKTLIGAKIVAATAATGSAVIPTGTEAQRDAAPSAGLFRFNTDTSSFEGYNGSEWGAVGGGNSTTAGLWEHAATITENYTIQNGNNAMSAGPVVIDSGATVTIPSGSRWIVL